MLMWVMSDRAIPRSYRMMQGFGVHTFRLVNAEGESHFVKFHWKPKLGTHSLVWDEAVKISGADPDFHRRDLWEAIEAGEYPEWELGLQVFTEEQADALQLRHPRRDQDHPRGAGAGAHRRPHGARTAIPTTSSPRPSRWRSAPRTSCRASTSPTIRCSPAASIRTSTRRSRAWAARTSTRSRSTRRWPRSTTTSATACTGRRSTAAASPTSPTRSAGGCPFQAGSATGFVSFPQPVQEDKVRGKPEKFADHYTQARLFFESQTPVEQRHIVGGFRFELSKVTVPAIRERMVSSLVNVSPDLAAQVADGLGIAVPAAMPRALPNPAAAGGDDLAGAVADGASRRRRHPHPQGGDAGRRRRRCGVDRRRQGRADGRRRGAAAAGARGSAATPPPAARRSRPMRRSRTRRRCCSTRWCCPTARPA